MCAEGLRPPVAAQKVSQSKVEWGSARNDSYAWLQDKTHSNPEVLSYLEQVRKSSYARPILPASLPEASSWHLGAAHRCFELMSCIPWNIAGSCSQSIAVQSSA